MNALPIGSAFFEIFYYLRKQKAKESPAGLPFGGFIFYFSLFHSAHGIEIQSFVAVLRHGTQFPERNGVHAKELGKGQLVGHAAAIFIPEEDILTVLGNVG